MNPETMITCVMVDDPAKTTAAKLTNYHVNRIQVNCYSSEASEANDSPASLTSSLPNSRANSLTNTLTNGSTLCGSPTGESSNTIGSSNGSSPPTHSPASSSSSRLFFVDQKLNQQNCINQIAKQSEHPTGRANGSQLEAQGSIRDNRSPIQRGLPGRSSGKGSTNSAPQAKSVLQAADAKPNSSKAAGSTGAKSIYSEQSLKKQIHQFKERQQTQLRYYSSSTSSSASSTASSKQYLSSKRHLIDKHLSDKNLSESEPLSSLNYSLNYSNCSTTDTLLTKSTLRSTDNSSSEKTADCGSSSPAAGRTEANSSTAGQNLQNAAAAAASKPHELENKNGNQPTASSSNQNAAADPKAHLNELYLFSIKRPSEFKHYTHEIKFMKTPGCSCLSFSFIFIAILVISLLFTIVVYISERTFEGQMVSLSIGQLWDPSGAPNRSSHLNLHNGLNGLHKSLYNILARILNQNNRSNAAQQLYQFFVDDLRAKLELVFNRSEFADRLKRVEIASLRRIRPGANRTVNNDHRYDRFVVHNVKRLESSASGDHHLSSADASDSSKSTASPPPADFLADLTAITSSIFTTDELLASLSDYLPNSRLHIEFRVLFSSSDLDLELSASSVYLAISSELIKLNESLFSAYNLDQSSLSIKEIYPEDQLEKTVQQLLRLVLNNSSILHNRRLKRLQLIKLNRLNRTASNLDELDYLPIDNRTESEDKTGIRCEDRKLSFCQFLPYNRVMWPNLVNHRSLEELQGELIYFRQIMDSECFHLAREFICLLLHPPCPSDSRPVLPCGELCEKFISSCSPYIPGQLRDRFYSCEQLGKLQDAISLFRDKNGRKYDRTESSFSENGDSARSDSVRSNSVRSDFSFAHSGLAKMDDSKSKQSAMHKTDGGKTDFVEDAASGQMEQIAKTMESNSIVRRVNEQSDEPKDANHSADNNANDGKQIRPISLANEAISSELHSGILSGHNGTDSGAGSNKNLVNSIEPVEAAKVSSEESVRAARTSSKEERSERVPLNRLELERAQSNEMKAVRMARPEERPQGRARRQSAGEWKIEFDDKNNLPDAKDTNSDDKLATNGRPSPADTSEPADRSSSAGNNRQLSNNCFNLEHLAQLT